jgi:hypothetical protein
LRPIVPAQDNESVANLLSRNLPDRAVIGTSAEPQISSRLRSNLSEIRFRFSQGELQSCFVNDESGDPFYGRLGGPPL